MLSSAAAEEEEAPGKMSLLSSLLLLATSHCRGILTPRSSRMSFSVNFLSFAIVFEHSWKKLREESNIRACPEILLLAPSVKPPVPELLGAPASEPIMPSAGRTFALWLKKIFLRKCIWRQLSSWRVLSILFSLQLILLFYTAP